MIKNFVLPNFFKPFSSSGLIRIGKDNDGGYLIENNSMLETDMLITLGIDHDWSFEEEFFSITNCVIQSYDGSVGPLFL